MALFRLDAKTSTILVRQPESGMGFQIVRYRNNGLLIVNATVAIPLEELRSRRFTEEEYLSLAGDPNEPLGKFFESLSLHDEIEVVFSILDAEVRRDTFGLSFSETASEPPDLAIRAGVPHSYYRFSPFIRDKRVDKSTGTFLPGTYATTYADIHHVPSGFAAVGRYALPISTSARFVFQIVTTDRPSLIGTTAPNFGQAGGGVEVLFKNGATPCPGCSFSINVG